MVCGRLAILATCNLNQWAMDFEGNLERIIKSIKAAKQKGAKYRVSFSNASLHLPIPSHPSSPTPHISPFPPISSSSQQHQVGPELEIPGYGCEDHFLELDTVTHSWECIAHLLSDGHTNGIVVDIGAPIVHRGVRYNCRLFLLNGKILLIRPKLYLANNGNYREPRWFASWKHKRCTEDHPLPFSISQITGQKTAPFGDAALRFPDAVLAAETCEELFTPSAPHIDLALGGVDIITNGSGSHHELRKLGRRLDLMKAATAESGGVYVYANQRGCDGGRLYYDGCACVVVNGNLVVQGSQFGVTEVEVVTACVDLDEVTAKRGGVASFQEQASAAPAIPFIEVDDFFLCGVSNNRLLLPNSVVEAKYLLPEEEIARGPACWLWDYLRRSGASGYLLPLSGGADSSSVAAIVGCMCQMVVQAAQSEDEQAISDVTRILGTTASGDISIDTLTAEQLANRIFTTVYMGTENSSSETKTRAATLAKQIGSSHLDLKFDIAIDAVLRVFSLVTGGMHVPRFSAHGGSDTENLALQNLQARLRMVLAFLLAQLMPWVRSTNSNTNGTTTTGGGGGFLLVLGSSNVDEALRGYLTKYDASSADINPIGSISKGDLKAFLKWAAVHLGYPVLAEIEAAPPTAELVPLNGDGKTAQTDEADMGMTYEELGVFGRLRALYRYGPVSMFRALQGQWRDQCSAPEIAAKVKHFFKYYAINRHKATTLTPAYHCEAYSPEDNRHDHRQFLYNSRWPWQFRAIDDLIQRNKET